MTIDHRLATYGTLAPGKPNHHELENLQGEWRIGTVRGTLVPRGWGADLGYPAIVPGDEGGEVTVHLFVSADLPRHWKRLDAFEGDGYRRVAVSVAVEAESVDAWIYVDAGSAASLRE